MPRCYKSLGWTQIEASELDNGLLLSPIWEIIAHLFSASKSLGQFFSSGNSEFEQTEFSHVDPKVHNHHIRGHWYQYHLAKSVTQVQSQWILQQHNWSATSVTILAKVANQFLPHSLWLQGFQTSGTKSLCLQNCREINSILTLWQQPLCQFQSKQNWHNENKMAITLRLSMVVST
jgi:hypothetical protein